MGTRIRIVGYDASWPERFRVLAAGFRAALGETARRIDHIGSTSVPGLDAKPIVDIQISVDDLEALDAYREPLEGLGYVFRHDNGDRTKRYFREPPDHERTHVHVRALGSWGQQFPLLFRDYLRVHPDDARRYGALKRALAEVHGEDREAYTDAKVPFVWEVMQAADRWSKEVGWRPGPSDG